MVDTGLRPCCARAHCGFAAPQLTDIVRIIVITDKQFERMNVFHGKTRSATEPAPEQISFSETAINTALDRPTAKHQIATNMVSFW